MIRVLRYLFISLCSIFDSLPAVGRHIRPSRESRERARPRAPSAGGASDDGSRSDEDGDGIDEVSGSTPSADDYVRGLYDKWVALREARGVNSAPIVFFPDAAAPRR